MPKGPSIRALVVFATVASLASCASALRRDPPRARLHFEVGVGFLQDGRHPDALAEFQKARELDSTQPAYLMHVGLAYYKMGLFPEAEKTIEQACLEQESYPECWHNLSVVNLESKQYSAAAQHAQRALETVTYSSPESALAVLARAEVALKRYPAARRSLDRALHLAPENCGLRNVLTHLLIRSSDFENALEEARRTAFQCKANASSQLWEAYAYYKIGQRAAAEAKYQRIRESFRTNEALDASRVALERLKKRIPLDEPRL